MVIVLTNKHFYSHNFFLIISLYINIKTVQMGFNDTTPKVLNNTFQSTIVYYCIFRCTAAAVARVPYPCTYSCSQATLLPLHQVHYAVSSTHLFIDFQSRGREFHCKWSRKFKLFALQPSPPPPYLALPNVLTTLFLPLPFIAENSSVCAWVWMSVHFLRETLRVCKRERMGNEDIWLWIPWDPT